MATNIPPHNLGETIDAVVHFWRTRRDPRRTDEVVKGPDFPDRRDDHGASGHQGHLRTGRGSIKVRAVTQGGRGLEGRSRIVVTELPYQVNKARLAERSPSW